MKITEIKVFPVKEEKLKAFVSVVFDGCFMVNDIKIIRGRDGLFISMPSRRKKNGRFKDVAHPLNNETRQMIEGLVLAEYDRAIRPEAAEEPRPAPVASAAPADEEPVAEISPPPAAAVAEGPESEPAIPLAAAGAEQTAASDEEESPAEEKTLEEVTEIHLRDSFWTS